MAVSVAEYGEPTAAAGSETVVTLSAAGTVMDSVTDAEAGGLSASVTVTVKSVVPVPVGVPEMSPVAGCSLSPAGSAPAVIDQVYLGMPPAAASVAEYNVPTVPCGSTTVVTANGATSTVIDSLADAVAAGVSESVTVTVKSAVPTADEVPEIIPVAGCSLSPAGNAPAVIDQV